MSRVNNQSGSDMQRAIKDFFSAVDGKTAEDLVGSQNWKDMTKDAQAQANAQMAMQKAQEKATFASNLLATLHKIREVFINNMRL